MTAETESKLCRCSVFPIASSQSSELVGVIDCMMILMINQTKKKKEKKTAIGYILPIKKYLLYFIKYFLLLISNFDRSVKTGISICIRYSQHQNQNPPTVEFRCSYNINDVKRHKHSSLLSITTGEQWRRARCVWSSCIER